MNIQLVRNNNSALDKIDFNNIQFGKHFSDHMFVADYRDGVWQNLRIEPYGPFQIDPANITLHYSQTIFEGMKATKNMDGTPCLFRPYDHARRMNESARRICMPEIPENLFVEALQALIRIDEAWIPNDPDSALYIRPFMIGMDNKLGVRPSNTYRFMVITSPVGPYYPKPVKLIAAQKYVRAVPGGAGEAKTGGNYAATLEPMRTASEMGFDQIMWMDNKTWKYIQECGTMNLFFVIDGTVITPPTAGAILKGITRDSFIKLLQHKGIPFEERPLNIDEVVAAWQRGQLNEVFGSGTAAVVAFVDGIQYKDLYMELPPIEDRKVSHMLKKEINGIRKGLLPDPFGWITEVPAEEPAPEMSNGNGQSSSLRKLRRSGQKEVVVD